MDICGNEIYYDFPFLVRNGFFSVVCMVEIPNIILNETCYCVLSLQAYETCGFDENLSYVTESSANLQDR